jgi:hypothetical protein
MSSVTERSYERTVCVHASVAALYQEMKTADGLVRFLCEVESHLVDPEDGHAVCQGMISVGPLSYRIAGDLVVEGQAGQGDTESGASLRVALRAPSLRIQIDGTLDLIAAAARETTLRYAATIRSSHPLLRRFGSALTGTLEEHVDSATDRIAVLVSQYTAARRQLSDGRYEHN